MIYILHHLQGPKVGNNGTVLIMCNLTLRALNYGNNVIYIYIYIYIFLIIMGNAGFIPSAVVRIYSRSLSRAMLQHALWPW